MTQIEDLTTAGGAPMFDAPTREYLRRARSILQAGPGALAPAALWLTARCPECNTLIEGDGLVTADPDGATAHVAIGGVVVLGCMGLRVINPAALGLDPGPWQDWTEDIPRPAVTLTDETTGQVRAWTLASPAAYVHDGERFPRYDLTQTTARPGRAPQEAPVTHRQSDNVGGPAEQKVRAYLRDHTGQWVASEDVRQATGLPADTVAELLLILALQDEINREPDPNRDGEFIWWMPPLVAIPYAYTNPEDGSRVCPACGEVIAETYQGEKPITTNYADHYLIKHETRDPDWLAELRITTDAQRAYWGEQCAEGPERPEYATGEAALCREHMLGGACWTCGEPMTCFGREPGDFVCEGLEQGNEVSAWRHQHGPYAHYEPEGSQA